MIYLLDEVLYGKKRNKEFAKLRRNMMNAKDNWEFQILLIRHDVLLGCTWKEYISQYEPYVE